MQAGLLCFWLRMLLEAQWLAVGATLLTDTGMLQPTYTNSSLNDTNALDTPVLIFARRWGTTKLDPLSVWVNTIVAMQEMALLNIQSQLKDMNWSVEGYEDVAVTVQDWAQAKYKAKVRYAYAALGFCIEDMARYTRYMYMTGVMEHLKKPILGVIIHPGRGATEDLSIVQHNASMLDSSSPIVNRLKRRGSILRANNLNDEVGSPYPSDMNSTATQLGTSPADPIRIWTNFRGEKMTMANFFGAIDTALLQLSVRDAEQDFNISINKTAEYFNSWCIITWNVRKPTMQPPIFLNLHAMWALRYLAIQAADLNRFEEVNVTIEASWYGGDLKPVGQIWITNKALPSIPRLRLPSVS